MKKQGGHTAFVYDFTPRELLYFFFGKKTCPHCGGKLSRRKGHETFYGHMPYVSGESRISAKKVKRYRFTYACARCGREFPLSQLAGQG